MQACKSIPKSTNTQLMPSFLYSSCSSTNMWWLKNCWSFSLVKLMHSCSNPLYWMVRGVLETGASAKGLVRHEGHPGCRRYRIWWSDQRTVILTLGMVITQSREHGIKHVCVRQESRGGELSLQEQLKMVSCVGSQNVWGKSAAV